MQNRQTHPNTITSPESAANNLQSTVGATYTMLGFDKQADETVMWDLNPPINLLAIGTQDLDEVIRQDRLEYEQELLYEAELQATLRRHKEEEHVGMVATVHYLPPPEAQAPAALASEYPVAN